ncbi:arsenate reductase family protein [Pontimicrobium sp. IMCC45349]|uniref:arsenate reductase family protein n=1 Tax=Pontimicrobium sp. IMCC45349 TaxID=3391574 RepID=UPI0039A36532
MKKIYYLKTCNTCMRILKELNPSSEFLLQDIKETPITVKQLEEMHNLSGNYEALFSKRAKLYKEMDLKNQSLEERDYKQYILEHYTFLKRPVIINNNTIFIGNSKKTIEAAKIAM